MHLTGTIDVDCTLGEGPVWDDRLNRLWWTDIQQSRLYWWDWADKQPRWISVPERLGSMGLTTKSDWLICAFASGFALYQPTTGVLRWLARPEEKYRGIRFNDGRVDRLGCFWSGTMVEDAHIAAGAKGSLYRLTATGKLSALVENVGISNSLAFSTDGRSLWFADSARRAIWRFNIPGERTELSASPAFAVLPEGHAPDGSDIDSEGGLWNAEWGGSRLVRYLTDGTVDQQVNLPVSQPTCIAFGGPNLDHMFVTTATEGLDGRQREAQPLAGKVLILRTGFTGLASPQFSIDAQDI